MKFDWYNDPSALLKAMRIKLMEEIIEIDIEMAKLEKEIWNLHARHNVQRYIERKRGGYQQKKGDGNNPDR